MDPNLPTTFEGTTPAVSIVAFIWILWAFADARLRWWDATFGQPPSRQMEFRIQPPESAVRASYGAV